VSTRRLLVEFDRVAARWLFVDVEELTTETTVTEAPGIYVERNASGAVVQLIADTRGDREVPEQLLPMLAGAFGRSFVAGFLRHSHLDEFELSTSSTAVDRFYVIESGVPPLPGEPGVPIQQSDGTFTVTDPRGVLRLVMKPGELIVTADHRGVETGMWVVVSDSRSGVLLSTGRFEALPDGVLRSRITFGLSLQPDELHLLVAAHPLEPVAPRGARLASWAHQLVETSERSPRWRFRRRLQAATEGLRVAQLIGDETLELRAEVATRRAKRWTIAVGVATLLLVGGAAGFATAHLLSEPAPQRPFTTTPSPFEDCDAARRAGPTPLERGQPGYSPDLDRDGDGLACE